MINFVPQALGTGMYGAPASGAMGMAGLGMLSMQPQFQALLQIMQTMAPAPSAGATPQALPTALAGYMSGDAASQAAYYQGAFGPNAGFAPSDLSAMVGNYFGGKGLVAGTSMAAAPNEFYGKMLGGAGLSSADLNRMISNLASGKVLTEGTSLSQENYLKAMQAAMAQAATATGEVGQGTDWGRRLAADAEAHATGKGGWCLKYAGQALARFGVRVSGASAYMAADQMARSDKFHEVKGLTAAQLKELPAGAVVVWDRSPGHPHGHISISLGDGREASDVIRRQATSVGTGKFRVFMPNQ